ncbi:MAG: 3-deoxy-manno-octulosonate cytidylyltransferase [bacterium]|nr:3-deoxy-manno-octulosonate cytidylyltransferase [bacterium]
MKILGVIPARLKSTRLPEKMLLRINNRPLVAYTYFNALKSRLDDVIIAVDHPRMVRELSAFKCRVMLTSSRHRSGTDRVAEVTRSVKADFYVNIQGDEPLVHPAMLNKIVDHVNKNPHVQIVTLGRKITDGKMVRDPAVVKIVMNNKKEALYFSRSVIPFNRDNTPDTEYIKHFGIYCFQARVLKELTRLKQTNLEKTEKLEQLRFLQNGYRIDVVLTEHDTISVDTPADFRRVKRILEGIMN